MKVRADYPAKAKTYAPAMTDDDVPHGRLKEFLQEIAGEKREGAMTSSDVFTASRTALLAQRTADS